MFAHIQQMTKKKKKKKNFLIFQEKTVGFDTHVHCFHRVCLHQI